MQPNILIPAVTSVVAFAFVVVMVNRALTRRQPYYLLWSLGLLWYALATGSEAVGGAAGWSTSLYRVWYLTGAIGVAAYLGAGTLYLHRDPPFGALATVCILGGGVPALATNHLEIGFTALGAAILLSAVLALRSDRFADATAVLLILATLAAAGTIANAPIDTSLLPTGPDQIVSGQAFNADTRALTPPFNIGGALILILGALLSAFQAVRGRALSNRLAANILIAVGAFVPSVASGLTRFGITSAFFLGELIGLACIFAGFLLSGTQSTRPRVPKGIVSP